MKKHAVKTKIISAVAAAVLCLSLLGYAGYVAVSAEYRHRSALSELYEDFFALAMAGDKFVPSEKTAAKIEERRLKNKNYRVPAAYKVLFDCSTEVFEKFEVCFFGTGERTVLYLHGGAYVYQPSVFHFDYCRFLSEKLSAKVIMPVYPKAPEYDYKFTLDWLYKLYKVRPELRNAAVVGDSAGGGMSLCFCRYLIDRSEPAPKDVIAFSPCVDLSLSNPEISRYAPKDPWLNADDLRRKFAVYADGDLKSPYVSPAYCDFSDFGEVTVFTGTREILCPDILTLKTVWESKKADFSVFVAENQNHVFAIYPMPERELCLEIIKTALSN